MESIFSKFYISFSCTDWEDDRRLSYREVLLCVKELITQSAAAVGFDLFGS